MGCLQGSASDPHRDPYRIHIGSMYGPQRGPCFAITVFCWGNFAGGGGGGLICIPSAASGSKWTFLDCLGVDSDATATWFPPYGALICNRFASKI